MYKEIMDAAWAVSRDELEGGRELSTAYWLYNSATLEPTPQARNLAPSVRLIAQLQALATRLDQMRVDFDRLTDESERENVATDAVSEVYASSVDNLEGAIKVAAARAREIAADIGHYATLVYGD